MRLVRLFAASAVLLPSLAGAADAPKGRADLELHAGTLDAELHTDVAKDLDVPPYPGAQRIERDDDGDGAITLGFTAGDSGFHLSLARFHSGDAPAAVIAFYLRELGRRGPVVRCDASSPKTGACKDFDDTDGTVELRVGPEADRRSVAITPSAGGTKLVLMHLVEPGKR